MDLNIGLPESGELKPRIMVFGVGGAGGNAVNNMIAKALDGVEFVVANTDAQALEMNQAENRLQLGEEVTQGLGAGAKPSVGQAAAEESVDKIVDLLIGSHMCFITAGMGGGTGTGAAPIIAQAARQLGILTVGVVTKPFQFEGSRRMRQAEEGIEELQRVVDTLIVIPNQNLFRLANEATTFTEAFNLADDVLYQGVKGVTDLMVRPGLINLDFADIRAVMDEMGKAMMGTGEADGDERAVLAADRAIANPLLDEVSLAGARGVLINITGGQDMTLFELDEAANKIREEVDPEANIIVGSTLDPDMAGKIRVSVVATGIDAREDRVIHEGKVDAAPAAVEAAYVPEVEEVQVAATAASADTSWESQTPHAPQQYRETEREIAPETSHSPMPAPEQNYVERADAQQRRLDEAVRSVPPTAPRVEDVAPAQRQETQSSNSAPSRGVSGLIERITGANHAAPRPQNPQMQNATSRPQTKTFVAPPTASSEPVERNVDEEQDRIDIPAFLRRQAN